MKFFFNSLLSEKYKSGKIDLKSFYYGIAINWKAKHNLNIHPHIYVLKNN
jgi:hypothetical protein